MKTHGLDCFKECFLIIIQKKNVERCLSNGILLKRIRFQHLNVIFIS